MFCVRILPSLCGFPCGSNFCLKGLLFAFKFTCPLRDVSRLCDVSIIDLSKMIRGVIPSTIILLVTKPISITPVRHLFRKQVKKSSRSKQSLKAKANHSLKKLFRINHCTGAWVHWQCQSCSRYSLLMRGYREIGLRTAFKSYFGHYHYHRTSPPNCETKYWYWIHLFSLLPCSLHCKYLTILSPERSSQFAFW